MHANHENLIMWYLSIRQSDFGIRYTVSIVKISRSFLWYAINELMHVIQLWFLGIWMVILVIFQDQIMGAKSSVYRMPLINRACKVNVNVKQRHWFQQSWFNRYWLFKDFLALEPKTLGHRTSVLLFYLKKKWKLWILELLDNWWT